VSSRAEDAATLRTILGDLRWRIVPAATCHAAINQIARGSFGAVICENTLVDGTWKDILNQVGAFPSRPMLIVTSRTADDYLWTEVLNLGGYDVLAKPFDNKEVQHVFDSVWHELARPVMRHHAGGAA